MSFPCLFDYHGGSGGFVIVTDPYQFNLSGEGEPFRIARALGWSFDATSSWFEWSDPSATGGTYALAGPRKIIGSFAFAYDVVFPQHGEIRILEGRCYAISLVSNLNLVAQVPGNPNAPLFGQQPSMIFLWPVLITRVGYVCDIRDGSLVEGSADFISSGDVRSPPFTDGNEPGYTTIDEIIGKFSEAVPFEKQGGGVGETELPLVPT